MTWAPQPLENSDFDRFLSAVKLLADAALTGADFDDFALHFERAETHPLHDGDEFLYIYNVKTTLEDGLDHILVLMRRDVETGQGGGEEA